MLEADEEEALTRTIRLMIIALTVLHTLLSGMGNQRVTWRSWTRTRGEEEEEEGGSGKIKQLAESRSQ